MNIGENIRRVREWKGFRREYVATRLDMHLTSYGNIERGQSDLSVRRLLQIADVLEVPPAALFGEVRAVPADLPLAESIRQLNAVLEKLQEKL